MPETLEAAKTGGALQEAKSEEDEDEDEDEEDQSPSRTWSHTHQCWLVICAQT